MAVAHLQEKGLRHVTFCGESQRPFIDFWTEAYQNVMAEPGTEAVIYQPSARIGLQAGLAVRQNERRRWIGSLPKPVGIIGWATGIPVFKKHHGSTPARHRANARLGRRGRSRPGPVAPSSRWP